ncbi:MAG: hypothetical protein L0Y58_23810 [Verrucomicrobia subdivision 3 bacterium]|nr:hypothetical protein [Limisphaerales bacterium]
MAVEIRLLGADLVNTATTTVLYTVPPTVAGAVVYNVRMVNTGGAQTNVNLFFKPNAGAQVSILDKDKLIPSNNILVVKPNLTMAPSDKIELVTTGTPSIEWVVCGVEKL